MKNKCPFKLPAKARNGFKVEWWKAFLDSFGCPRVELTRAVYHRLTKWRDFERNLKGGADIENEWMIYAGDSKESCGRSSTGFHEAWSKQVWFHCHAKKDKAIRDALRMARERLDVRHDEIDRIRTGMRELNREFNG